MTVDAPNRQINIHGRGATNVGRGGEKETRTQWIVAMIWVGVAATATMAVPTLAMGTDFKTASVENPPMDPVPTEHPIMIQGVVTAVHNEWATVQTSPWRPYCPPKTPCPMIIIAGFTYEVNIVQASYEEPSGLPAARNIAVGERVTISGTAPAFRAPSRYRGMGATRTMMANIIERSVLWGMGDPYSATPPSSPR